MSGCCDKNIGIKLHHYELGLLEDHERLEFEQHIIDCDYCFEQLTKFQNFSHLMKSDPSVRELISTKATSNPEEDDSIKTASTKSGKKNIRYYSALATAAIILLFLVLKDWQIDIKPSQEVFAHENQITIMYFGNLVEETDSSRTGQMITTLLITDLTESHYLKVVPTQRVNDILDIIGKKDRYSITNDVAEYIAQQTHSRWILNGSVMQILPYLVVSTQLVDAMTGQVQASRRIEARDGQDIFAIVDSLTVLIKEDLSFSMDIKQDTDRHIANVTTSSKEAYRYYLEAKEYLQKAYRLDAARCLKKAIEYDSTFAMAYYFLAVIDNSNFIEKALKYSDNVNWKEKQYILSMHALLAKDFSQATYHLENILERDSEDKGALEDLAGIYYQTGNYTESAKYNYRLLKIDPVNKIACNNLAYIYFELNNYDSSLYFINKYIELAPDEANPYDTRGDLNAAVGKIDEAIASYREALKIKPDYYLSLEKYGHLEIFKNNFETADSCYKALSEWNNPEVSVRGFNHFAYIPLYQGKINQTLDIVNRNIDRDLKEKNTDLIAHHFQFKALLFSELGMLDSALQSINTCIEYLSQYVCEDKVNCRDVLIRILAQNKQFDLAEQRAKEMQDVLNRSGFSQARYWYSLAVIEYYKGNLDSAASLFDKYAQEKDISPYFSRRYFMAKTYFEDGRLADAVTEFQALTSSFGSIELYWGIEHALSYYYLGRAYEESSWYDRAIKQYEIFLERWKDSDFPGPEISDARIRLANLQKGT
ncbi:MAG: tetratricopeptide repeat protein [Candidatus Zixiibacteriota bacterium]